MLCVTPAPDPCLCAGDLKVTGRVSRTCQNYKDPSVDCGGTAGKSVTDQKQMTLNSWNHFSSRSLLTFSKVEFMASLFTFVHANVFIQFWLFGIKSV